MCLTSEMYNAYQMGALGKRGGGGSRQNVRDLLRALEMEAELEAEEEAMANQGGEMAGIEGEAKKEGANNLVLTVELG